MCGRFALSKSDRIDWAQFGVRRGPALPPHWNLGPGRAIAAVRQAGDGAEVAMLHWGLIPSWAKDATIGRRLANARAESAADKPSFRAAFRHRRCLVPASGFFEWQPPVSGTRKQPWFIRRADDGVFAIAALWERWQPATGDAVESCALLTTSANSLMQPIHDRMPVIIAAEDYAAWLSPATAHDGASALLRGWDPSHWAAHRVSTHVNAVANDDAACIVPREGDAAC